ncbi:probable protein S-acyltransferase 23 [Polypterus senegalus]|uniref:probable protein S-acyltransferase 23 n=1 Tax=Polypterus senegalus TaxID=55291 RepID=UPI001964A47F|nr:probable protein S-acyltransferase 23 [Polypterus senegalus]
MVPAPQPPAFNTAGQHKEFSEKGHMSQAPSEVENEVDIFQAAKTGNLNACWKIVEAEGTTVLRLFDNKGHTPVHWAALIGSVELIKYFINCNVDVNRQSNSEYLQRPIHWAAVNGHISVVDLLHETGVSLDVTDKRGCTPLILASQYGHTELCCYLIGKGAQLYSCDNEGDNALHWAAFKGYCELTRLLIYSGFSPQQADIVGQTPLHLAVLSGDLLTVQLLCEQDCVEIEIPDKNGNTPLMLSKGRKSKEITLYLENAISQFRNQTPKCDLSTLVFGPPGKSKGPILFFFACLLLWGYPTYFTKIISVSFNKLWEFHVAFLLSNVLMWFLFLKASLMDPGFLSRDSNEYDETIRQAVFYEDWKNRKSLLHRLCHTCRLVKPLRSKHCRITNRCVKDFDHYCPYVYNSVGYNNRVYFLGFLASMCFNCFLGTYLCIDWFYIMGRSIFIGIGFIFLAFIGVITGIMSGTYLFMAAKNLTTNEHINQKKYFYLKDEEGQFSNQFDRGILLNLLEFFHLEELLRYKIRNIRQLKIV